MDPTAEVTPEIHGVGRTVRTSSSLACPVVGDPSRATPAAAFPGPTEAELRDG